MRPASREQPPRIQRRRAAAAPRPAAASRDRLALQSPAANHIQLEPFARHDARFDALGGSGEGDHRVRPCAPASRAPPRCPDRDVRPVPPPAMTTRAAVPSCRLPSITSSTRAPDACCDTFSRMPMPTRLMSSDDPPALTNGSGMPFVGISAEHDADVDERLHGDHRRSGRAPGTRRTDPARGSRSAGRAR